MKPNAFLEHDELLNEGRYMFFLPHLHIFKEMVLLTKHLPGILHT